MLLGSRFVAALSVEAFGAKRGRDDMQRKGAVAVVVEHRQRQRMHGGGKRHGRAFGQHRAQRGGAVRGEVVRQGGGETSGGAIGSASSGGLSSSAGFCAFMSSGRIRPRMTPSLPSCSMPTMAPALAFCRSLHTKVRSDSAAISSSRASRRAASSSSSSSRSRSRSASRSAPWRALWPVSPAAAAPCPRISPKPSSASKSGMIENPLPAFLPHGFGFAFQLFRHKIGRATRDR